MGCGTVSKKAAPRMAVAKKDPGAIISLLAAASLARSDPAAVVGSVRKAQQPGRRVAVLIPEVQPRRWRCR